MVRVIWHLRRNRRALLNEGYDGIYIHGIPLNMVLPRGGPKRINHVHGLNNPFKSLDQQNGFSKRLLHRFYEWMRRKAVKDSDLILLAGDQQGLDPFKKAYPSSARLVALPNFCDMDTFGAHVAPLDLSKEGFGGSDRILLYVGRLSKEKDPILAVRILAALHTKQTAAGSICLVMIGGGALEEAVWHEAQSLGVQSNFIALGMQPRAKIARWMRSADVLLLTSHFEGFPVVLAEAAQSGLPMICPEITGVHDLVLPGETGAIVNSRHPEDFVVPVLEALSNRDEYGARARELAARYTSSRILDCLCEEIADVI
jgi:glycosyltransferase involved in cell wall biosynthesis